MNADDGMRAVVRAREIIEHSVSGTTDMDTAASVPASFRDRAGVFVTLMTFPNHELRGCIGIPEPVYPFNEALAEAARGVCTDPRFPPLTRAECDSVTVEVSILTPPEPIAADSPDALIDAVTIGVDGLIAESGDYRGLLLPQVPVEWGWSAEEFLSHTCAKAGLPPNSWRMGGVTFLKFQAHIFAEETPRGTIVQRDIAQQ